jgi:hypothetical protein
MAASRRPSSPADNLGARIRGRFRLVELVRRRQGEFMMRYEVKVEIEDSDKPAISADWLTLSLIG